MQTPEHLRMFQKWSNMNEGAGYKAVPTTTYKSDNNHALQTILGNGLFELHIASFEKKCSYRSDDNGTVNRHFDLHQLYNLFFCKT